MSPSPTPPADSPVPPAEDSRAEDSRDTDSLSADSPATAAPRAAADPSWLRRHRWTLAAAAVLTAAAVAAALQWGGERIAVVAIAPRRMPLAAFIEHRGKTHLPRVHQVTMPMTGKLLPEPLEEGEQVSPGQLLARIDQEELELEFAAAEAAVALEQAVLKKSQSDVLEQHAEEQARQFLESILATVEASQQRLTAGQERLAFAARLRDRYRELATSGAVSRTEVDRAELDAVTSQLDVRQDQLVLSAVRAISAATAILPQMVRDYVANKRLEENVTASRRDAAVARRDQATRRRRLAEIASPIHGVLLRKHLSAPRHLAFGEVLFEVGALEQLEVETDLLSDEAAQISLGAKATIHGDGLPAAGLPASVARISPLAFTKVSSLGVEQQRVQVFLRLPEPAVAAALQAGVQVGYNVQVRIAAGHNDQALVIPRTALFRDAAQAWNVFVVENNVVRLRTVAVGLTTPEQVEITSGLTPEDRVIAEPDSSVREGVRVRLQ